MVSFFVCLNNKNPSEAWQFEFFLVVSPVPRGVGKQRRQKMKQIRTLADKSGLTRNQIEAAIELTREIIRAEAEHCRVRGLPTPYEKLLRQIVPGFIFGDDTLWWYLSEHRTRLIVESQIIGHRPLTNENLTEVFKSLQAFIRVSKDLRIEDLVAAVNDVIKKHLTLYEATALVQKYELPPELVPVPYPINTDYQRNLGAGQAIESLKQYEICQRLQRVIGDNVGAYPGR